MEGRLLNFTPHDIHIYKGDKVIARIPRELGQVIRLFQNTPEMKAAVMIGNCEVPTIEAPRFTGINLMPPRDSSIVVSMLVADFFMRCFPNYCEHIFVPDTGPEGAVRDTNGQIIGTTRLLRYK